MPNVEQRAHDLAVAFTQSVHPDLGIHGKMDPQAFAEALDFFCKKLKK